MNWIYKHKKFLNLFHNTSMEGRTFLNASYSKIFSLLMNNFNKHTCFKTYRHFCPDTRLLNDGKHGSRKGVIYPYILLGARWMSWRKNGRQYLAWMTNVSLQRFWRYKYTSERALNSILLHLESRFELQKSDDKNQNFAM